MNDIDLSKTKCSSRFNLLKKRDDKPHPFERVAGGDGVPVTITTYDEDTGQVLAQVVTFEPQQLGEGACL